MRMHVLSGGRLRMRRSTYLPDAEKHELMVLPVSCFLLRHAQGNVLFDTGCHPSTAENAEARWGGMAKFMTPISKPEDDLPAQLGGLGLSPLDIDVVVNSHLHSDHCGCNEFFKRATVFCHRDELKAAEAPDGPARGYLPVDWRQPMPLQTFEGQHDLCGDGRILLLPLPGHTPGMTGARVQLDRDGSFLLASDAVPLRANLERDLNPRNTWNAELSSQSMAEVRRIEAAGTQVLFGHDDAQWATLRKGADAYE